MNNPLELLFRPHLRGPFFTRSTSASNQWAGRTTLNSGDTTVVVSTALVNSNSVIMYGIDGNAGLQSSGVSHAIEVTSISSGNHFTFATAGGESAERNTVIMWQLTRVS